MPSGHDPEGRGVTQAGRLARLPALDGLRGIGLPMVMLYHHGLALFGWIFHGSILCVSMFFTLSGFLITRLLVQEHAEHDRISLRRFYARRLRRLMPAALTVALLIALIWTVYPSGNRGLDFPSFFWAIFYGTNLMLLFRGSSYQNLFAEQSPLQHTWSLSLEEQIYIVFPLVLIGILSFTRLRRSAAGVLMALAAASFASAWMWAEFVGDSRPYYATEARAGEFLVGAAVAVFWARSPLVPRLSRLIRSRLGTWVGVAVLVLDIWLWIATRLDNHYLFRGATALNAVLVAVLMAYACAAPLTGASRVLSVAPLVAIGKRAYTLYLVHWPVFVLLSPEATGLSSMPLLVVRLLCSAAVGEVIYRFVEGPILRERIWPGRRLFRGCALLAATGLALAMFAPASAINRLLDPEALALQQQLLNNLPQITAADPTRAVGDDTLPARVLVVGDSQAWFVGTGMVQMWGEANGVHVEYSAGVGCGTTEVGAVKYLGEQFDNGRPGCFEWADNLPRILARFRPQVVVVAGGLANISDHRIDGRWQHIGELDYDAWLLQQMRDFAAAMSVTGAHVVWLTNPDVDVPNPPGVGSFPEEDPQRMARHNELIGQLADELAAVDTADLATVVQERPGGQFDPTFRPDGAHILLTEAPDVVEFIADAIVKATSRVP